MARHPALKIERAPVPAQHVRTVHVGERRPRVLVRHVVPVHVLDAYPTADGVYVRAVLRTVDDKLLRKSRRREEKRERESGNPPHRRAFLTNSFAGRCPAPP